MREDPEPVRLTQASNQSAIAQKQSNIETMTRNQFHNNKHVTTPVHQSATAKDDQFFDLEKACNLLNQQRIEYDCSQGYFREQNSVEMDANSKSESES